MTKNFELKLKPRVQANRLSDLILMVGAVESALGSDSGYSSVHRRLLFLNPRIYLKIKVY